MDTRQEEIQCLKYEVDVFGWHTWGHWNWRYSVALPVPLCMIDLSLSHNGHYGTCQQTYFYHWTLLKLYVVASVWVFQLWKWPNTQRGHISFPAQECYFPLWDEWKTRYRLQQSVVLLILYKPSYNLIPSPASVSFLCLSPRKRKQSNVNGKETILVIDLITVSKWEQCHGHQWYLLSAPVITWMWFLDGYSLETMTQSDAPTGSFIYLSLSFNYFLFFSPGDEGL